MCAHIQERALTNSLEGLNAARNQVVVLVVDVDGGLVRGVSVGPSELVLRLLNPLQVSGVDRRSHDRLRLTPPGRGRGGDGEVLRGLGEGRGGDGEGGKGLEEHRE